MRPFLTPLLVGTVLVIAAPAFADVPNSPPDSSSSPDSSGGTGGGKSSGSKDSSSGGGCSMAPSSAPSALWLALGIIPLLRRRRQ